MSKVMSPVTILLLAILSCVFVMPEKIMGRNLFYLSSVITLIYAVINRKRLTFKKEEIFLSLTLLMLGASQLIWSYRFPGNPAEIYMADVSYPRSGAYLMIGAVMMLLLPGVLRTTAIQYGKSLSYVLVAGFSVLTLYALHYHFFVSGDRLRIDNSATLSAYLYTIYSLLTLYALACVNIRYRNYIASGVIFFSLWIIFLTETRSALLIYPAVLLYALLTGNVMSKKKSALACLMLLVAGLAVIELAFPSLKDRASEAVTEISDYQSDNNTSMGSRLSMWHTGIYEIIAHPGGVSSQQRFQILSQLMYEKEQGNPEGLRNIVYHLHNDLIETMSLQGVIGGLFLLALYGAMLLYVYRKATLKCALAFIGAPVILFGCVDTLFIHDRFIIMFIVALAVFTALSPEKSAEES
ncbi:O-antigen ligase family protein [Klebsiella aerogenes]|uniref:O-antigen ligase family protein n=1 Tax=Klebsiella aerogenes TaxID=548 RepID=UPI0023B8C116|nr:O-antigen ligase family protein [Klebsiella aerogenes]ELA1889003.1 O-antigen ligase family protein [Klebsiella aerogenes]MDF0548468.1 O-antigen ligase family protein [Klebsiella aerogenes]HBU8524141.1 O-antigen ligase family protein [Klebsiella aerogenes]HBV9942119.1 O-antigen ligase family protein [Klebsiella aerogenes]HDS5323417.1 O-antigen ligase family protein [Klebsiella aerogenes]